jgi:hypothetical protein
LINPVEGDRLTPIEFCIGADSLGSIEVVLGPGLRSLRLNFSVCRCEVPADLPEFASGEYPLLKRFLSDEPIEDIVGSRWEQEPHREADGRWMSEEREVSESGQAEGDANSDVTGGWGAENEQTQRPPD